MWCVGFVGGCVNGEAVQQSQPQTLNCHTIQPLRI